jgi:hypothetical protein
MATGGSITVAGSTYKVRDVRLLDDGELKEAVIVAT